MEFQGAMSNQNSSKKNKVRGAVTKQCDTGIKTDIQTNGIEQRAKKTNPYVS